MKLISLNIEGHKHFDLVSSFLEKENADIVCLLEAPEDIQDYLKTLHYYSNFAPMCLKDKDGRMEAEGIVVATKTPHTAEAIPYHSPTPEIVPFDNENKRETIRQLVLYLEVGDFKIGVTHFTWNPIGETANEQQKNDMDSMLTILNNKPPHILAGDLNIPRHYNELYDLLTERYSDNIPQEYKSSLDKHLHRLGSAPEMQKLFDDFMVDYVLTQNPYIATDTRLVFGISDHAAVISFLEYKQ